MTIIGSLEYIIGNSVAVASNSDIEKKHALLPDIFSDALALRFGLDGYDPISDKEIAEDFRVTYNIPMTEGLVSGIVNDALYMVNYRMKKFPEISIKDNLPSGMPDDLKYKKLTWNMIINFLAKEYDEDDLEEYISEEYGDMDCVIVPGIDDLYFTYTPVWYEVAGLGHTLNIVEVLDFRGIAEFIIEKLDDMGICVVSDIIHLEKIRPSDIYKYAYLNTELAMKVIRVNPLKLIRKIKQGRCL